MKNGVNEVLRELGFVVGIPYYVFYKDMTRYTTLLIEGQKVKGFGEIRYTLYRATYEKRFHGKMTRVYVYLDQKSVTELIAYARKLVRKGD